MCLILKIALLKSTLYLTQAEGKTQCLVNVTFNSTLHLINGISSDR